MTGAHLDGIHRGLDPGAGGHLLSTCDLSAEDVNLLCARAAAFAAGDTFDPRAAGRTIALLFFQASTRTRFGFQAAAFALGCLAIGMDDMGMSRSNERTGESLEDCAAVLSRTCDVLVVRHHQAGAAARMAARSCRPVLNAGDGWNEHPTQALIDVFALRCGLGALRGKTLAFCGDPRGRTVRSLVHLLRHEEPAELLFCPPPHIPIPADVLTAAAAHPLRLRVIEDIQVALRYSDALMMTPYDMSDIGEAPTSGYCSPRRTPERYRVTAEKLARAGGRTLLYHPLPRQDEVDPDCDALPNARYFEQVRLAKFMRMAVLERALMGESFVTRKRAQVP